MTLMSAIKTWAFDINFKTNQTNLLPKLSELNNFNNDETIKFIKKDLKKAGASMLMYQLMMNAGGGKYTPDVLLGIIPLFTVSRYETAFSQDIIKYRAIGGEFLAQQRGGNVAFKTIVYLHRVHGLFYLQLLEALYFLGNEYEKFEKNIASMAAAGMTDAGLNLKGGPVFGGDIYSNLPFGSRPVPGNNKALGAAQSLSKEELDPFDPQSYFTPFRMTFPVITKETIMYSMYIESMITEVDVEFGDWMKVSLLLRQYNPPPSINWTEYNKKRAMAFANQSKKQGMIPSTKVAPRYIQERPDSNAGAGPWSHKFEQPLTAKAVIPIQRRTRNESWVGLARWSLNGAHRLATAISQEIKMYGKSSFQIEYPSLLKKIAGSITNNGSDKLITLTAQDNPTISSYERLAGIHYIYEGSSFVQKSLIVLQPKSNSDIQILTDKENEYPMDLLFGNTMLSGKYLKGGKIQFNNGTSVMIDKPTLLECEGRFLWFRKSGSTQIICYVGD